jgi:hypothetical protein
MLLCVIAVYDGGKAKPLGAGSGEAHVCSPKKRTKYVLFLKKKNQQDFYFFGDRLAEGSGL